MLANDLTSGIRKTPSSSWNLPTLQAQLALSRKDASKAVEALQAAAPYELGMTVGLHPIYVRGEAYLAAHDGSKAAAEFQKIVDHRVLVLNPLELSPILSSPALMLYKATRVKAKAAYQDFLALWKDADPDVQILKQAKTEYSRLQ